jgi:hypothetical protein
MIAIGLLFVRMLCDYFKSRPQLEAEIVILRHQLNLLQRAGRICVDPCLFIRGLLEIIAETAVACRLSCRRWRAQYRGRSP